MLVFLSYLVHLNPQCILRGSREGGRGMKISLNYIIKLPEICLEPPCHTQMNNRRTYLKNFHDPRMPNES